MRYSPPDLKSKNTNAEPPHDPRLDLIRAVRLCHPGWETLGRVTLCEGNAAVWPVEIFRGILRPHLESALAAAAASDSQALLAADRALGRALPDATREASCRAGRALLAHFSAPPAEKCWLRHARFAANEETPGHLAVAVAVRAAAFHLAPGAALSSYLLLEARGGMPDGTFPQWVRIVDECLAASGGSTFALRAA